MQYLDYVSCTCRKGLIDKLMLECKAEVLNAIPLNIIDNISSDNKKVAGINNCLIYTILLIIFVWYFCWLVLLL